MATTTDTHAAFDHRLNFSDIMTTPTFSGRAYLFGTDNRITIRGFQPTITTALADCVARLDCQRPPMVSDDERQEVDIAHGARERKERKYAADQASHQIAEPIDLDAERDCGHR